MKLKINFIIAGLLCVFALCNAQDIPFPELQAADLSVSGEHPRLLLLKGEEEKIKRKIESDGFLRRIHRYIIRKSDRYIDTPVQERIFHSSDMLKTAREIHTRIYYLSYAWRMTGDPKYVRRAEKEMLNACTFQDWNPDHYLDVAEICFALAIGYDWMYDSLSEETKATIEENLFEKGLKSGFPGTAAEQMHCHFVDKRNNWNPVCHGSLALAAITAYEHDPKFAERIIKRSITKVKSLAIPEYGPDGNFPEGYSYWSYGTTFALMFIETLEKVYGTSFGMAEDPGFLKTPEYILQMSAQGLDTWRYSDCTEDIKNSYPMFWFAARRNDPSLLWGEKNKIMYMDGHGLSERMFKVRFLPSVLLWAAEKPFDGIEPPSKRMFVGQGTTPLAIMRNHFGGDDEIFLGLKGGKANYNHAHMDIGSFVMFEGTTRWATDAGIQDYYSLERFGIRLGDRSQYSSRWKAFRLSPKIHNIVTFADTLQRVKEKAVIVESADNGDFMYAITDLSKVDGAAVAEHLRGVAMIDGKQVVVRDEITASDKEMPVRWAMFTPAKVRITGRDRALLSLDGKELLMVVEGKGITMDIWSTEPVHEYDEPNPGTVLVGFTAHLKPGQKVSFNVHLIPQNGKTKVPHINKLSQWKKY